MTRRATAATIGVQMTAVTILAIVASVLSGGGIVSQIIAWRRKRDEDRAAAERHRIQAAAAEVKAEAQVEQAEVEARVELAKVEADTGKHELALQQRLLDRIDMLERKHDENVERIARIEIENGECKAANRELRAKNERLEKNLQSLQHEHEVLRADHAQLRLHVARVEEDNKQMRTRLAQLDREAGRPG